MDKNSKVVWEVRFDGPSAFVEEKIGENKNYAEFGPMDRSLVSPFIQERIGWVEEKMEKWNRVVAATPQYTVTITSDYGDARVVKLGVDAKEQDDMIVQRREDGVWFEVRKFNTLTNDSAYTEAGALAKSLATNKDLIVGKRKP